MDIIKVIKEAQEKIKKSNINTNIIYLPVPKNVFDTLTENQKQVLKINGYEFIEQKDI